MQVLPGTGTPAQTLSTLLINSPHKKGPRGPAHSSLHPPPVCASSSTTSMAQWLCEHQGGRGTDRETLPRQSGQSTRKHHPTCTLLRLNRVTAMNHSTSTRSASSKGSCKESSEVRKNLGLSPVNLRQSSNSKRFSAVTKRHLHLQFYIKLTH